MQVNADNAGNFTTRAPRHKTEHKKSGWVPFNAGIGFLFLIASVCLLSLWLGGSLAQVKADSAPSFNNQVAPIFQKNCLACHSSAAKMGGLVMENYDALMKGGAHGAAIVPGKPDQSRLIEMLDGKVQPRMPFGGDPLSAADIATLKTWVESGASGPASGESS